MASRWMYGMIGLVSSIISLGTISGLLHLRSTECILEECYCEHINNSSTTIAVAQIINGLSAVFFNLIAIYLSLDYAYHYNTNRWYRRKILPHLYVICVSLLGSFSFALHGIMTGWAQLLDQLSLQFYFNLLIVVAISRRSSSPLVVIAASIGFFSFGISAIFWIPNPDQTWLLLAEGAVFLLLEVLPESPKTRPKKRIYLPMSLIFLAVGVAVWMVSHSHHDNCEPHGLLQGHALWHVLCAWVTLFLWEYFATEGL